MIHLRPFASALLVLAGATMAYADINLTVENGAGQSVSISQSPLQADRTIDRPEPVTVTLDAEGRAKFTPALVPVAINVADTSGNVLATVFSAAPSDNISVVVDKDGRVQSSGTPLMEDITVCDASLRPIVEKSKGVAALYDSNPQEAEAMFNKLQQEYNDAVISFISSHPDSPAAVYALMQLNGEEFLAAYETLTPQARTSILMPAADRQKLSEEARVAAARKLAALENGSTPAPAFTLPNLDGKMVSLSEFKGKWVILDFWGSWCRWCVKGFPELKELTQKYGDKLAIIGIDCRDSQERWREAVAKYELTWTNLYNNCEGESNPLLESYAVQGFPTKVIVDPQGIIRKIVVGADPAFPQILASFMGE